MPDYAVSPAAVAAPDRRAQILDCTCRVIARDGADGVRMAAVAREAGVSSALLHYYFATREDLIRLAFEHHDARESARSEARIAEIADPLERIRNVLAHELSDDAGVREGWILWTEMERTAVFRDDFRVAVAGRATRWVGIVAALIADAQSRGAVAVDVDAASAAMRLTCLVDGLGQHVIVGCVDRAEAVCELDVALQEMLHLDQEARA